MRTTFRIRTASIARMLRRRSWAGFAAAISAIRSERSLSTFSFMSIPRPHVPLTYARTNTVRSPKSMHKQWAQSSSS